MVCVCRRRWLSWRVPSLPACVGQRRSGLATDPSAPLYSSGEYAEPECVPAGHAARGYAAADSTDHGARLLEGSLPGHAWLTHPTMEPGRWGVPWLYQSLTAYAGTGPQRFDTRSRRWGRIAAQSETRPETAFCVRLAIEPAVRVFPGLRNSPAAERGQARTDEEDLPAQEARTEARTRLPGSHGFQGRSARACPQTREGAQAAYRLTRTRAQ
jgi:hypothetical protein